MVLLKNCYCGLTLSSAVIGVYLTIAYIIAFALETWWILEAQGTLPFPAYLLCLGYFVLFIFSSLLLYGLSVKRSQFLLVWMFVLGLLLGPEAGLVLYISIHHWRITSLYGLIEVTCWACRLIINSQMPKFYNGGRRPSATNRIQGYVNQSYQPTHEKESEKREIGRYAVNHLQDPLMTFTEFDAATFDSQQQKSTIKTQHKPKEINRESTIIPKTRSLIDLRDTDFNNYETIKNKTNDDSKLISLNYINNFPTKDRKLGNCTQSLDRKSVRSRNLKLLKKLSPFLSKKSSDDQVNVYRVNPPKIEGDSNWDSALNRVYSRRGMYVFDEKTRNVVYYPPEMFDKTELRARVNSYGSSMSRSSAGSDDFRHISDVAL